MNDFVHALRQRALDQAAEYAARRARYDALERNYVATDLTCPVCGEPMRARQRENGWVVYCGESWAHSLDIPL